MKSYLLAAYEEIFSYDSHFRYSYQWVNRKIPIQGILYFESNGRMVRVVTEKEAFKLYGKLNGTEESLKGSKASFFTCSSIFFCEL